MVRPAAGGKATLEDLLALGDDARVELIDGSLSERAAPAFEHGDAQAALGAFLRDGFHRRGGGGERPGGWWIATEVTVALGERDVYTPDIVGWRRDHHPVAPTGFPVRLRPDWICEVVSSGQPRRDTIVKLRAYHAFAIPHYWIVDPERQELAVYRWASDGYLRVLSATRGETVHAERFEALALAVGVLFGDDPE